MEIEEGKRAGEQNERKDHVVQENVELRELVFGEGVSV